MPLVFTSDAAAALRARQRSALVLTRPGSAPGGASAIRHADAAARAQAGACSCCHAPPDVVVVLRRLMIERARGVIDFAAVVVDAAPSALAALAHAALADPFVAARYATSGEPGEERPA
jgi:hypothetical protein